MPCDTSQPPGDSPLSGSTVVIRDILDNMAVGGNKLKQSDKQKLARLA
jgi:hypothetical protein